MRRAGETKQGQQNTHTDFFQGEGRTDEIREKNLEWKILVDSSN